MENISFSREKALPFSLEKLETIFNNLVQRDTYSNKILSEPLSEFYKREMKNEGKYRDNFLQIVEYTLSSLEKIAKNPKKELLKVSELQPITEIRSTDYKTMIWLGNKPGKTLAEKIGVKGKILAPKNKYSIDKKENRVVVYYFKKAYRILFRQGLQLKDALEELEKDFSEDKNVKYLVDFIKSSDRGIAR